MKKVACRHSSASVLRIEEVDAGFGPSSKVRTTSPGASGSLTP